MREQTKYQQLQPEARMTIASITQQGSSVRAMARTLSQDEHDGIADRLNNRPRATHDFQMRLGLETALLPPPKNPQEWN